MQLRRAAIAVCALALGASVSLAACGNADEKQGVDSPAREGLALELDGVKYDVFLTRELNPRIQEDTAYVTRDAPPGQALYGVFIQACNHTHDSQSATDSFTLRDNQNDTFQPKPLPSSNPFAYHPRKLGPKECIPAAGSVAQLGPTAGSLLLFQLPLSVTENRPLELEIHGPSGGKLTYDLDI